MKIYTKTGDDLTTSTITKRVYKDDEIIECIGTIDELSASLMVASNNTGKQEIKIILVDIVKDLFGLAADLLRFKDEIAITNDKVKKLEDLIDKYQEKLPSLTDFILPGTTISSSYLHLARTVARRLERRIVTYGRKENVNQEIFQYINRLSDLIFVLARYVE